MMCKQMLVELRELNSNVKDHDSKVRVTEESPGKKCGVDQGSFWRTSDRPSK